MRGLIWCGRSRAGLHKKNQLLVDGRVVPTGGTVAITNDSRILIGPLLLL